jgi:hypothetical protein
MPLTRKLAAEFIGTFWLVLGGAEAPYLLPGGDIWPGPRRATPCPPGGRSGGQRFRGALSRALRHHLSVALRVRRNSPACKRAPWMRGMRPAYRPDAWA